MNRDYWMCEYRDEKNGDKIRFKMFDTHEEAKAFVQARRDVGLWAAFWNLATGAPGG